jgi:uncharacterized integral membrane protein
MGDTLAEVAASVSASVTIQQLLDFSEEDMKELLKDEALMGQKLDVLQRNKVVREWRLKCKKRSRSHRPRSPSPQARSLAVSAGSQSHRPESKYAGLHKVKWMATIVGMLVALFLFLFLSANSRSGHGGGTPTVDQFGNDRSDQSPQEEVEAQWKREKAREEEARQKREKARKDMKEQEARQRAKEANKRGPFGHISRLYTDVGNLMRYFDSENTVCIALGSQPSGLAESLRRTKLALQLLAPGGFQAAASGNLDTKNPLGLRYGMEYVQPSIESRLDSYGVLLNNDGTYSFAGQVPAWLRELIGKEPLSERGLFSSMLSYSPTKVSLVVLGSGGRYFVRTKGGRTEWAVQDKDFTEFVHQFNVKTVAFGEQGSYFVLASTGQFQMKSAPSGFEGMLKRHRGWVRDRPIAHVTWGPSGEWFIRFEDGGITYQGSRAMMTDIEELQSDDSISIKQIVFGEDNTWVVLYGR